MNAIRRVIYRHTAGPYPGLTQIVGFLTRDGIGFYHTGEFRPFTPLSGTGDVLAPIRMWPDGRLSKGMRIKATDKYILYQERLVEAAPEASQEAVA